MPGRRILSLWFPRLAAERVERQRQDVLPVPLAVVEEVNGAQILASLTAAAEAAGLRLGQPLRDATAICPDLLTLPADPLAEARFLGVLRRWAGRFSPWVAEEPPASLLIDLTGSAHLFGGEAAVLDRVAEDCAELGLSLRAGIADTTGAAWALARYGRSTAAPLRSGDAIDQEARATRSRAPLHFAVRLTLPDPIGLRPDIEAALDRLLPALCDKLQARGRGVRRLAFQAFRADGGVSAIEVGLARAANTPDRIRPLLQLKLDQIDAGFGIDCLRLHALATEALMPVQTRSVPGAVARPGRSETHALDDLVGRLSARLGDGAVTRLHPAESHLPSKDAQVLMAAWSQPHDGPWPVPPAPRPLVIFRPEPVEAAAGPELPARFRWRRRDFALRMAVGPERLQAEWWLEDPDWREGTRDYWRVEAEGGDQLWLFYGRGGAVTDGWYCEGVFA